MGTARERMDINDKHREMQTPCVGCFYQRPLNGNGECGDLACFACDYLLLTGRRRPCKPGKDCTVRDEREKGRELRIDTMPMILGTKVTEG